MEMYLLAHWPRDDSIPEDAFRHCRSDRPDRPTLTIRIVDGQKPDKRRM